MRFAPVKSEETQGAAMAFRKREMLIRQRTQAINALRGHLTEFGQIVPQGAANATRLTASHNPMDYNGMKMVRGGSAPLDAATGLARIKALAKENALAAANERGSITDISDQARVAYVDRVVSFVSIDALKPLKILVNAGHGAAGPTFDAIAERLQESGAPLGFERLSHNPDGTFPQGIPNPLLPENRPATAAAVRTTGADFGVAWDGDFDRCFFFDHTGTFIDGEYVVGLLAEAFLAKDPGATIIHDPRIIWNTQDIVAKAGGRAVQTRTGYAFIKQAMRDENAVYGGEMSAHHYFRDFVFCDSGMIPWLLVAELVSRHGPTRRSGRPPQDHVSLFERDQLHLRGSESGDRAGPCRVRATSNRHRRDGRLRVRPWRLAFQSAQLQHRACRSPERRGARRCEPCS